jgi:hypothetical protein
MKLIRVGIDLAKNVFQIHGVDRFEKPVWRRKLGRSERTSGESRALRSQGRKPSPNC